MRLRGSEQRRRRRRRDARVWLERRHRAAVEGRTACGWAACGRRGWQRRARVCGRQRGCGRVCGRVRLGGAGVRAAAPVSRMGGRHAGRGGRRRAAARVGVLGRSGSAVGRARRGRQLRRRRCSGQCGRRRGVAARLARGRRVHGRASPERGDRDERRVRRRGAAVRPDDGRAAAFAGGARVQRLERRVQLGGKPDRVWRQGRDGSLLGRAERSLPQVLREPAGGGDVGRPRAQRRAPSLVVERQRGAAVGRANRQAAPRAQGAPEHRAQLCARALRQGRHPRRLRLRRRRRVPLACELRRARRSARRAHGRGVRHGVERAARPHRHRVARRPDQAVGVGRRRAG
mmetsp:Transcript_26841/g.85354  ORF Transcript_26841/g.85354 Transcript_26841/m.85354 type:complete len:345 (-) Transcript_26841:117-1151(-)